MAIMPRFVWPLAPFAVVALVVSGCVVWPEGGGPGASPVPLVAALALRDRGEAVLIDVRSREDYARGHLPGALNIAANEIEGDVAAIRRMDRTPILYVADPTRPSSARAARALQAKEVDGARARRRPAVAGGHRPTADRRRQPLS